MGYKLLPAKLRWALCLLFEGGITRWGTELLLLWQPLRTKPGPWGPSILQNKTTPRSYLIGNATLHKCTRKVLQSLRLALLVCKWTKPGKRALHSVSVLWSSLDPSFLEAIQAQETRGWVDRSLFPEGTRNLNLSQALDPFPSLPLRSEFLWNASPPVQTKHSPTLTILPPVTAVQD